MSVSRKSYEYEPLVSLLRVGMTSSRKCLICGSPNGAPGQVWSELDIGGVGGSCIILTTTFCRCAWGPLSVEAAMAERAAQRALLAKHEGPHFMESCSGGIGEYSAVG
jgi:hypothetical protein